jgi:hypothetical protein
MQGEDKGNSSLFEETEQRRWQSHQVLKVDEVWLHLVKDLPEGVCYEGIPKRAQETGGGTKRPRPGYVDPDISLQPGLLP